jgi:hypothetical protein
MGHRNQREDYSGHEKIGFSTHEQSSPTATFPFKSPIEVLLNASPWLAFHFFPFIAISFCPNWAGLSALAANSPLPIRRTIVSHLREVTTMIDFRTAKILGHRRNIQRYARLLAGELTDLERQYLHKRIAEEHAELERLQESHPQQPAVLIAAEDMGKGSGEQS